MAALLPESLPASTLVQPARAPVTYARGDGIGPEIMDTVLGVLDAAGASLALEEIRIGRQVYESGMPSGIAAASWESLRRTRVFLKAPITTPQGGGYKSLNVTARKALGLFANVRPCVSYHPLVPALHPRMNVVIVRENEEDTYAGIEHRPTPEVVQCLKLVSQPGCERVIRYAFEYARRNGRRKVTCLTKDNIMKLTDGMFHATFDAIAREYPELESGHMIIDIGTARMAARPQDFDVVVTPNLYGDILSDVAAEVSGSIGMAASANIGEQCAMFEAVHGSAPDIAGQDVANPSGLLLASVMMLNHVGQAHVATRVHNAWLRVLEQGLHTADIYREGVSRRRVGTREFAAAVTAELGARPRRLQPVDYTTGGAGPLPRITVASRPRPTKELVGIDIFLDWDRPGRSPDALAGTLGATTGPGFDLKMITNRGVKVWPGGFPETFCTDHWRCRFVRRDTSRPVTHAELEALLGRVSAAGFDYVKTEHLYLFDGKPGYSLGQGE